MLIIASRGCEYRGGGANPNPDRPIDPSDPDADPAFDLNLKTIDYWVFKLEGIGFETMEFLQEHSGISHKSQSMIRWESEHSNEVMFSFTGSIFRDRLSIQEAEWRDGKVNITFDGKLKSVMPGRPELETKVDMTKFEEGSFVITNHRLMDFRYQAPGNSDRDNLSRDVVVLLRDRQGNAHYRRFGYREPSLLNHRNYVVTNKFTPL